MSRKRKTENIQMLNSILSDNMPDKRRKIHFDKNGDVMTQNSIQNFQKLKEGDNSISPPHNILKKIKIVENIEQQSKKIIEEKKVLYDKHLKKIKDNRNNILKMKEIELNREMIAKDKMILLTNNIYYNDKDGKINRDSVTQHEDGLNKFNKFSKDYHDDNQHDDDYHHVDILQYIEKFENDIKKFISQEKLLKRKKKIEKSKNQSMFEGKEDLRIIKISNEHRLKKELIKTKEGIELIKEIKDSCTHLLNEHTMILNKFLNMLSEVDLYEQM